MLSLIFCIKNIPKMKASSVSGQKLILYGYSKSYNSMASTWSPRDVSWISISFLFHKKVFRIHTLDFKIFRWKRIITYWLGRQTHSCWVHGQKSAHDGLNLWIVILCRFDNMWAAWTCNPYLDDPLSRNELI